MLLSRGHLEFGKKNGGFFVIFQDICSKESGNGDNEITQFHQDFKFFRCRFRRSNDRAWNKQHWLRAWFRWPGSSWSSRRRTYNTNKR